MRHRAPREGDRVRDLTGSKRRDGTVTAVALGTQSVRVCWDGGGRQTWRSWDDIQLLAFPPPPPEPKPRDHPSDEDLIGFRCAEALRHLREAEKLMPENTTRWRFVLAAQCAVEAVAREGSDE